MLAKSDLPCHPDGASLPDAVNASTVSDGGIDLLLERLAQEVEHRAAAAGDEGGIVTSLRQLELLQAFASSLASSVAALAEAPLEAALVDLKLALGLTGEILGCRGGRRGSRPHFLDLLPRQVTPLEALSNGAAAILKRPLSARERDDFGKYLSLLLKWQKAHRLVGSSDPMWIVEHLFLDSLLFLKLLPSSVRSAGQTWARAPVCRGCRSRSSGVRSTWS